MLDITSIANHIIMSLPFWFIGYGLGKYLRNREDNKPHKKYWQCCLYCKHHVNKGLQNSFKDFPYLYCLHPDNESVFPVDHVSPDFYCGKFEVTDAFATELFKMHSEESLKKSIEEVKFPILDKLYKNKEKQQCK